MKTNLLLILLICSTLQAQTTPFSQTSENPIDYYKSNPNELLDENGNHILFSNEADSIIINGETINDNFGFSVSTAGDVNNDGYSDVIVGATLYSSNRGRAYIYYGGSPMNNIADVTMTGEAANDKLGVSVSSAGDVNNDGYSDVIVGAKNNSNFIGKTYIYFGGFPMNNIADVIMTGEATNNYFGSSVSTAGDVNNDGYSDVIIGAIDYSDRRGRAYIYYGGSPMNNIADVTMTGEATNNYFGSSVSTAGDVNNDGYSDVIVGATGYNELIGRAYIYYGGSPMNNIADVTMTGEAVSSNLKNNFGGAVSTAGDINGDGFYDVIVGANYYNILRGRIYIYFGGSPMNNIADIIMTGETNDSRLGSSVSTAGDLNKDGYSDVIVSAYGYSSNRGRAYIYYGGFSMDTIPDIIKTGESIDDYFGRSVFNAGDVNNDGYSDLIVGANGYGSSSGKVYIYFNLKPRPDLIHPSNNSIYNPVDINFIWRKSNTAIYYILIISVDSEFNNIIVNDTIYNDTSKIITEFQKDKKYFWRVKLKDTSGITFNSLIWNFTTIPPIYLNIRLLFEGMYSPAFNQLIRRDSATAYLRQSVPPFNLIDSAKSVIDSNSFTGSFNFYNAETGIYYISMNHFNSIETWSKAGGEYLSTDGIIYNYDFTTSNTQAYGNNLKLKGSKYCIFSGDINKDGYISLFDIIPIYNDASSFITGRYFATDLTGDNIVDLTDLTLCYNNSANFIRYIRP